MFQSTSPRVRGRCRAGGIGETGRRRQGDKGSAEARAETGRDKVMGDLRNTTLLTEWNSWRPVWTALAIPEVIALRWCVLFARENASLRYKAGRFGNSARSASSRKTGPRSIPRTMKWRRTPETSRRGHGAWPGLHPSANPPVKKYPNYPSNVPNFVRNLPASSRSLPPLLCLPLEPPDLLSHLAPRDQPSPLQHIWEGFKVRRLGRHNSLPGHRFLPAITSVRRHR